MSHGDGRHEQRDEEYHPGEDGVNKFLSKNQVYAEDGDFAFVLDFIRSHTNCR